MNDCKHVLRIYQVLLCGITIAMLYFLQGWHLYRLQLKAWRKSPVAYFGTGHGAQLFAADGFMVLRTQEDNADKRELSYIPFGSCMNHGKSVFGGIVKVDGFPEFTAIPDNVYFLINGRVYRCPCPVDSGKRTGSFGLVDEYADHD